MTPEVSPPKFSPEGSATAPEPRLRGFRGWRAVILVLFLAAPLLLAAPEMMSLIANRPDQPPQETYQRQRVQDIQPLLGFAVNCHHIGDLGLYIAGIDEIATQLGCNALIITTPMWQRDVNSSEIYYDPETCPTDDQLIELLRRAKQHGMHTTLMPIVLLDEAGDKEWRGVIQPDDWEQWWSSYEDFLERFITIANAADVDMLAVGSELNTTEDQRGQWQKMTGLVRRQFGGQICYSSNWDRYDKVRIWDLFDVMSVSSYFELDRNNPEAEHDTLVRAWQRARNDLLAYAERWQMPLVLTEVGYPSLPWATQHPWNYVADPDDSDFGGADHEAQARGWRAFFTAWNEPLRDRTNRASGFFGYRWDPYHRGGRRDTGYGLRGKPGYEIFKRGIKAIKADEPTTQPAVSEVPTTRPG